MTLTNTSAVFHKLRYVSKDGCYMKSLTQLSALAVNLNLQDIAVHSNER